MKTVDILDKKVWDGFFEENGSSSFLQSWEWGEFQKTLNYTVVRIGVLENNKLTAAAQVIKIRSKRGDFLFVPHGPMVNVKLALPAGRHQTLNIKRYLIIIRDYLIDLAKKENYGFIRISPIFIDNIENRDIYKYLGFKTAPVYMHAETMWALDLDKPEEQLISEMRKTTRYLVRKAQRDGVIIEKRTDEKTVDDFYRLYEETAKRESFVPFSKKYIKSEFEAFNKTGNALFLFGKFPVGTERRGEKTTKIPVLNNLGGAQAAADSDEHAFRIGRHAHGVKNTVSSRFIASVLVVFTKSTAFYHQGASIHTKVPVTYLLQWEAIKEAKKRGCKLYNFWGIIKEGRTPKSWSGLTLFKQGFGGRQIDYLPTQDYPVSKFKYFLTCFLEKLLNWKRGV